jgi:hypothetical protein
MNSDEHELRAAQMRRAVIDEEILALEAERSRLDKHIADLNNEIKRGEMPCWRCDRPQSLDVRHWLALVTDPQVLAAKVIGGLPPGCCRVSTVQHRPVPSSYA